MHQVVYALDSEVETIQMADPKVKILHFLL